MRKLMIAVAAVAGMGLAVGGCNDRDQAARERRDLARTEVRANEDIANARLDAAKQKADIDRKTQEKIVERQQDVADKRQDAAQAAANAVGDHNRDLATRDRDLATGSSLDRDRSLVVDGSVKGVLTASSASKLEIRDLRGNKEKLKTDELTRVTENGRQVRLDDFREGTEVRASFVLDKDHDKVARDVQVLHPVTK